MKGQVHWRLSGNMVWCFVVFLWMGLTPVSAHAFCGFFVGSAGAQLSNDTTHVVLMREGMRTVLSMQNHYRGPVQDFAMIVPVPTVLQENQVKTLSPKVFDRVEALSSPRLVQYWEKNPCAPQRKWGDENEGVRINISGAVRRVGGVEVKASFAVGEYDIVVLSATDSSQLETWLQQHQYNIPKGAEKALRPYIAQGMKFFVAKVNVNKVQYKNGQALLSPLRFHYDSPDFKLPIRLGLLNAKGSQDLIVHILANNQRYEVSNYKNITIPTNIGVHPATKKRFGEFYAALFDKTIAANPNAVVTEYAWTATKCDPCPGPTISRRELMTFGGDILRETNPARYVLTRLHARYTKNNIGQDLIFKAAGPIVGGREHHTGEKQELEKGSAPGSINNFQARYIIRNPWKGPILCKNPQRGVWGGPPQAIGNNGLGGGNFGRPQTRAALKLAQAPRGNIHLPSFLLEDVPEAKLKKWRPKKKR